MVLSLMLACYRDAPPDIAKFEPPRSEVVEEKPRVEKVVSTAPAVEEPPPPPVVQAPQPPQPETKPAVVEKPAEQPPPAPTAPTIVGTWRAAMSPKNSSEAMPAGMEVTMTFGADGSFTMTMSMSAMPEPRTQTGSYSVSDGSITLTVEGQGDAKTGTLSFEGNDKASIDIEQVRMDLTRM